jgi:hypothetical protein
MRLEWRWYANFIAADSISLFASAVLARRVQHSLLIALATYTLGMAVQT